MVQWTLMTIMLMINLIFMNMKHPLAMGFILLMQTTMICIISSLMTNSFWYSYILFLIFIGGMLVLFIYVTSLASNEMFSFSMKLMIISFIFFITLMIILMFFDKKFLIMYSNLEINSIINMNSYLMENSISVNKLYNYPNNMMTILLINYLLITLIVIIKITKLYKGPLRPLFN
uniref:NADH-ubiquinone oxidoreductase chain 6 n=1 Tax=Botanophila rubrifrons TaxID=559641 RepID=A0A8K1RPG1_9MUSC|nr:NADH dehydrogenase subunit 6 [Botanophila rubrifrons]